MADMQPKNARDFAGQMVEVLKMGGVSKEFAANVCRHAVEIVAATDPWTNPLADLSPNAVLKLVPDAPAPGEGSAGPIPPATMAEFLKGGDQ